MASREEIAKEVLNYIRTGSEDVELREKYGHCYEGLQTLMKDLADSGFLDPADQQYLYNLTSERRKVSARQLLTAIRDGDGRTELMDKFALSPRGLQKVLRQLVNAKVLNPATLIPELRSQYEAANPERIRSRERYVVDFELPIYDPGQPGICGRVLDVTEKGVGVIGLPAQVDELKSLTIYSEDFLEIEPIYMEAKCRWVKDDPDLTNCMSGFQISRISERDFSHLRRLIQLLTV